SLHHAVRFGIHDLFPSIHRALLRIAASRRNRGDGDSDLLPAAADRRDIMDGAPLPAPAAADYLPLAVSDRFFGDEPTDLPLVSRAAAARADDDAAHWPVAHCRSAALEKPYPRAGRGGCCIAA